MSIVEIGVSVLAIYGAGEGLLRIFRKSKAVQDVVNFEEEVNNYVAKVKADFEKDVKAVEGGAGAINLDGVKEHLLAFVNQIKSKL